MSVAASVETSASLAGVKVLFGTFTVLVKAAAPLKVLLPLRVSAPAVCTTEASFAFKVISSYHAASAAKRVLN